MLLKSTRMLEWFYTVNNIFKVFYAIVLIRSIFFNKELKKYNNVRIGTIIYILFVVVASKAMLIGSNILD